MRYQDFLKDDIFLVSASGASGQHIFLDEQDKARFVFLITHMQSPAQLRNISWYGSRYIKKGSFTPNSRRVDEILRGRHVELLAFCIIDGGFSLLVRNLEEAVLSVYMQRILTSYSKYYNSKYGKRGHVFSGPFEAIRSKNAGDLEILSASVHSLSEHTDGYEWSSYKDYLGENRWPELLNTSLIMRRFKGPSEYRKFVQGYAKTDIRKAS